MVEHLMNNQVATPWLEAGMRKTSCVLAAFKALKAAGVAQKMLVVAPLRVARRTWPDEIEKWAQFCDLRYELLWGPKKDAALKRDADIYLINPEGIAWLVKKLPPNMFPFDTLIVDELTKFKNHNAKRHKLLRPKLARAARHWGMTGTPAANGYMDLFGQYLLLDGGAALGRYITHYRDQYFSPDFTGFNYTLQPGAEQRIQKRIAPYVISMRAEDYIRLPPVIDDPIVLEMQPAARKRYEAMRKHMIAELQGGEVAAANTAAAYSKLAQMANGAVYDESGKVHHLHDEKLDALGELLEQLQGRPLLLAYEFQHDRDRIMARFPNAVCLGKGVSAKREEEIFRAWNRNEIPLLLGHPASIGHGLNLQEGNAAHVAWFSPTWDLELWEQFVKRLRRSGNESERVFNHIFIVKDSIDELKYKALCDKDTTQRRLRSALNHAIVGRAAEERHTPCTEQSEITHHDTTQEETMALKLSKQGASASAAPAQPAHAPIQQPAPQQAPVQPAGWAQPAQTQAPAAQRAAITDMISPQQSGEGAATKALPAFAAQIQQNVEAKVAKAELPSAAEMHETTTGQPAGRQITDNPENRAPAEEPKPKRTRAKKSAEVGPISALPDQPPYMRESALRLAAELLKGNDEATIDDVLEVAQKFADFILK